MPKVKRAKKLDRKRYEDKARQKIKQNVRVKKALERAPSGYLTAEAKKLVPGNGLMSYVYTDKLLRSKQESPESDAPESDAPESDAPEGDAPDTVPAETVPAETAAADSVEDGFLGFDESESEDDGDNSMLRNQFSAFEETLEKEAEEAKAREAREASMPLPSHHPAPWNNAVSSDSMPGKLSREIKNYVSYMSPTDREIKDRKELVERIKSAVKTQVRGAQCQLFGSSATDMYLPQADVDMVLINDGTIYKERSILYQLKAYFLRRGWTNDAIVIGRARVPIIKFTDVRTRLNVDIAVGKDGGVRTVQVVNEWSKRQPALRPLVIVVKQYLKKRNLSEVYHGGLGGFATICLVMSFLENHEKLKSGDINAMDNMGVLLYEFYEFYGKKFEPSKYALRMTGKMPRVLKSTSSLLQTAKPDQISVEDPCDYSNNITRSSHNWSAVQKAFSHGADMLKRMMHEYSQETDASKKSFLGPLLKNEYKNDRHSVDVMKQKVQSLATLASNSGDPPKSKKDLKKELKKERKKQAKRKEEKNKQAKKPLASYPTKEPATRLKYDPSSDNSIVDLTSDSPQRGKKALKQVFEAASSSESDLEVTMVRKSPKKNMKFSDSSESSEEEVSRTKLARTGGSEKRRAYWAKKNGLEV